jgi:hypothetical protein
MHSPKKIAPVLRSTCGRVKARARARARVGERVRVGRGKRVLSAGFGRRGT